MKILDSSLFNTKPDAVLFDTDNTLYAYEPAHKAAMNAVREKASALFSIAPADFNTAFSQARSEVKLRLKHTASSHSRLLYFQRMLELMGLGSQVLQVLDFEQTYWRTFLINAPLFDGVKDFLDDLRIEGIPTAIVTDLTAQIQFRKIVFFGLDHYFDHIVTSEEAGADKPNKAPFDIAIQKMQPTGNHYWMIGDNAHNDILGGRQAIKATTIQKVHAGVEIGKGDEAPDAIVHQFNDLRKLLRHCIKKSAKVNPSLAAQI